MKLNSTEQVLCLILHALDTQVLPGVKQLAGVKFAVDSIRSSVDDLLKRQGPSIPLLKKCIEAGEILENDILSQLSNCLHADHQHWSKYEGNFDTLATRYGELTETLNLLCRQLSEVSSNDPHAFALLHRAAQWELMYYKELQQLKSEPFKDSSASALKSPPLSKELLEEFLISRHGSLEVASFERLPGGFGKQTFLSTIQYPKGNVDKIVVRKSDTAPFIIHKGFQLQWEYDLLLSLKKVDFPAPEPIDLATQLPGVNMEFFTMKKIRGQILSPFFDSFGRSFGENIWLQLAEKLAELHAIPLATFADHLQKFEPSTLNNTTEECYHRNIKDWEQYLTNVDHLASPCTTWIFNWLKRHVPKDPRRPVLVHGDFNVHNVLVDGSEITGILDWETSIFGAPEHDLAYIQPHVSRYIDWQKFLDHYKASGGQDVDPNHFNFYLAYTLMSFALGVSHATWNLQQGLNRDIRFVACEFGFTPYIYQAIVDCATPDSDSPLTNDRKGAHENAPASELQKHSEQNKQPPAVNGTQVAEKPKQSDLRMHVVPAKDGSDLRVFGGETNFRQQPGPQGNWQDSVVLVWWDETNQIGGFHRLGHEPNFEGGRVLLWNNLTSPEGIYKRDHYLPLRAEDKLPNGGFGGGDETCRYEFVDEEHLWTVADGDVSAQVRFKDHGPNVDCFPKKGTLAVDFAPQHFDIPGDITGWMEMKGRKYEINGLGLRDKGWGTRDWHALLSHRWVAGSCGPALGFVALAFHTVDDQLISFGWVVRNGKITFAESLDIVTYYELDSATNRGGHLQYVLTSGEVLEIECTPVPGKAFVSYQKGICCVDRLCTVTCNEHRGVCDFETTANIQQGTRRPRKFSAGILDNGFHPH